MSWFNDFVIVAGLLMLVLMLVSGLLLWYSLIWSAATDHWRHACPDCGDRHYPKKAKVTK